MKISALLLSVALAMIIIPVILSRPDFNGTTPGCSGSGCHTLQSGLVSATVLSNQQVQITLSGATGKVAGELVDANGTVVAVINSTSSNPFILTAPSSGTYTVNAGYKSPSYKWGTTTVEIISAPSAPGSLNPANVSNHQIQINWTDNSGNEDGFKIERYSGTGGTYAQIAQVGANITTYLDTALQSSTQYCYRVRSFNSAGNSAYSNELCVTTYPDLPLAPINLTAVMQQNPLAAVLNWTDNSNNEQGFIIEREDLTEQFNVIDTVNSNVTTYTDYSVTATTYNYRIKAYNQTGASAYSNISQVSLPVELTSFEGFVTNGKVELRWRTATETNNSGFEIERLNEYRITGSNNWVRVAFINGSGTTTETKTYSYTDENLSAAKYQYRLKQIDFDGTYNYSNVIELEILSPEKFSLEQNYPNPFSAKGGSGGNPGTIISWQSPSAGLQTLKVYDVLGNEVATLVDEYREAGSYQVDFNPANFSAGRQGLSTGVYYYRLTIGSFSESKKMMYIK